MVLKRICDFCGEEIVSYKNNITNENIKFNSKIKPGYDGNVKLSVKVCSSKEAFGSKSEKDICKDCFKSLVERM